MSTKSSSRLRAQRAALFVFALAAGCSSPTSSNALSVTVRLAAGTASTCVKVVVQTESGTERSTGPMKVMAGAPLQVAVYRDDLPATVSVQAQGYADDRCSARTAPLEESARAAATFKQGVTPVELVVERGAAVDADGDTYSPPDDCDDSDPTVRPGAVERCSDGIDNDCDQAVDCADPDCHQQACGAGAACTQLACKETNCFDSADGDGDSLTDCADPDCGMQPCGTGTGAICMGAACQETACGDAVDNDLDQLKDCGEPACQGQACGMLGVCDAGACAEPLESVCGDGADNDADGKVDCADSDCAGKSCDDGDACTSGEQCTNGGQCRNGTATVCAAAPGQCFASAGSCVTTTGLCAYAPLSVDAGCDDLDPCTVSDRCNGDGGCTSTPRSCPAPPGACFAAGLCQAALDGGCSYAVLQGSGCDDGDTCTVGDACGADGGCQPGALVQCTPPECKVFTPGSCAADGGCLFTNAPPNTPCAGGWCDGSGACSSTPAFPYTPDNVSPSQHRPTGSQATVIDCALTFTSGADAGFGTLCPGMQLPAISTADAGAAGLLTVVAFNHLLITATGSLTMTGSRPVVLLVWGDAGIDGPLLANSTTLGLREGPGASTNCSGRNGGNGTSDGAHGGGGGGAGLGTAGALGGNGGGTSPGGAAGMAADGGDVPLLAGCPGGAGIDSIGGLVPGGRGGGGLQLSVAGTLSIRAGVSVSGAGGFGGFSTMGSDPGGGGGGSGGVLLLEAGRLSVSDSAALTSNGGGGGGGADNGVAFPGGDGAVSSALRAPAGTKEAGGGNGGAGGAGTTSPDPGVSTSKGGGGGGGAVGRIFLKQATAGGCSIGANAVISPPAVRENCP